MKRTKKIFVVGDIHGKLGAFKALIEDIKEYCITKKCDYEVIITGDIFDRGNRAYETYMYVKNNPKIKLILGNHDYFYCDPRIENIDEYINDSSYFGQAATLYKIFGGKNIPEGIFTACHKSNGGVSTFTNILEYYNEDNSLPDRCNQKYDEVIRESASFAEHLIKYIHGTQALNVLPHPFVPGDIAQPAQNIQNVLKEYYPNLLEKIDRQYKSDEKPVMCFLYDVLNDMYVFLRNRPLIMTMEDDVTGYKYVMTHSGYVPLENDRIMTDEEIKKKPYTSEVLEGIGDSRTGKIAGHVVVHGHVARNQNEIFIHTENGQLATINLDGHGGYMSDNAKDNENALRVIRCLELGSHTIRTVTNTLKVTTKRLDEYNDNSKELNPNFKKDENCYRGNGQSGDNGGKQINPQSKKAETD